DDRVVFVFVEIHAGQGRKVGYLFAKLRSKRVYSPSAHNAFAVRYTLIVARVFFVALLFGRLLWAQQQPPPIPEPPEEDEALKPKEYALNPVQAKKEITAGNFYMKKGNYRAAATRFLEASRWDPGSAEAFHRLGEASEKTSDFATAATAYAKYLELDKD